MSDHYFKRLLAVLAIAVALAFLATRCHAASFPYIRLNAQTNRISDNGTTITYNGTAIGLQSVVTATKAFQSYQGTLTHAGTVTLDFDAATTVNSLAITGNVTFATSNLATNRTYRLLIQNTLSTNAIPTFPIGWHWLGGAPPTTTAGKWSMLTLEAWGATDASVIAAFREEE